MIVSRWILRVDCTPVRHERLLRRWNISEDRRDTLVMCHSLKVPIAQNCAEAWSFILACTSEEARDPTQLKGFCDNAFTVANASQLRTTKIPVHELSHVVTTRTAQFRDDDEAHTNSFGILCCWDDSIPLTLQLPLT
jgi:hypothetical protein